jgi:hypothetical protein
MKKLFPGIVFLLISWCSEARQAPSGATGTTVPINPIDLKGVPIRRTVSSVEGTPYLTEDWTLGTVKFANGSIVKNVPLRLHLLDNKVYFKKNEEAFEFAEPVREFAMSYQQGNNNLPAVFRNGYPAIERNNAETFYEVLADGKFQLLKYRVKRLQTRQGYSDAQKQGYSDKEQLYALLPEGRIVSLKKSKDDLIEAMPAYADAIKKWADEKKLKLKNEEQITQLFIKLNEHP